MRRDVVRPGRAEASERRLTQMALRAQPPGSIRDDSIYSPAAIPALTGLLDELAENELRYCLWKSTLHLVEGLAGQTDLDLLVDRAQVALFREIVGRHRLKPLVAPPNRAYPATEHYVGLDRSSGRLFHLHVHYQLVLGEEYVKNYRVPMEREFLNSTRLLGGVPVPRPELELSVLAVRGLLKYRGRDIVKDVLGIRSPGVREQIRAEMAWLLNQTTVEKVREALEATGGPVPPDLVCEFLATAIRAPRSGYVFFRLRGRLRRALSEQRRHSRLRATFDYYRVTWQRRAKQRRSPVDTRMTPAGGGLTVALVGADGSGKSTIADVLARWLAWKLEVRVHYMGSKAPSRRSRWSYLSFRALRRGHRSLSLRLRSRPMFTRGLATARDVVLALHYLSVGKDRARHYRSGQRDSQAGRIVIFDRFPLEALSSQSEHRMLDGPRISGTFEGSSGRLIGRLAAAEERIYGGFRLPDYLVILHVDPETSADRKPDHRLDILAAKSQAVSELAALAERCVEPAAVIRIDAARPLDAVLLDVKARLWDVI